MKSKLGTVRVWTRAVGGLAEPRTQDLGDHLVTYVPVRVCFGIEVIWVFWSWCSRPPGLLRPWRSGLGAVVLRCSGCLAAHIPLTNPHHMQT